MRQIPDIAVNDVSGYAENIAHGFDTVKETFNMFVPESFMEQMTVTKNEDIAEFDKTVGAPIQFGREEMYLSPYGTKSAIHVLYNDDFRIYIRSPKMEWCVSVEYSAAGLWEYGLIALRERALAALMKEFKPRCSEQDINDQKAWQRISIAHYAFDFYSPDFTEEMRPEIMGRIVCPAASKKAVDFQIKGQAYGRGLKLETLTIGKKDRLQVQIYDKGQEITDVSGKTWMFKVWEQNGYYPPEDQKAKDVWRLEIRMGSEFLKDRGILTLDEMLEALPALLTEAIFTRRLTVESVKDKNRWRWALHPLFVAAYRECGNVTEMKSLGRQQTESHLVKAERLKQTIAGNIRSLTVLTVGDMDELSAEILVKEAYEMMLHDPDGDIKTEKARRRYAYVKEAA